MTILSTRAQRLQAGNSVLASKCTPGNLCRKDETPAKFALFWEACLTSQPVQLHRENLQFPKVWQLACSKSCRRSPEPRRCGSIVFGEGREEREEAFVKKGSFSGMLNPIGCISRVLFVHAMRCCLSLPPSAFVPGSKKNHDCKVPTFPPNFQNPRVHAASPSCRSQCLHGCRWASNRSTELHWRKATRPS